MNWIRAIHRINLNQSIPVKQALGHCNGTIVVIATKGFSALNKIHSAYIDRDELKHKIRIESVKCVGRTGQWNAIFNVDDSVSCRLACSASPRSSAFRFSFWAALCVLNTMFSVTIHMMDRWHGVLATMQRNRFITWFGCNMWMHRHCLHFKGFND